MARPSVLFVCTHNSARSQIAEGLLRHHWGDRFEVFSAGTQKTRVKELAIAAMRDVGIDVSEQTSKTLSELDIGDFDVVVTVCDDAREACPYLPARVLNLHQRFDDPSNVSGTHEEKLAAFCRVRDEILSWLEGQTTEWTAACQA